MIRELKITFDALERFQGQVVVDVSHPLTVIVGPNGSGKSTILEAAAEVMIFLHRYPLEGPLDAIRTYMQPQRPTRPEWERATVEIQIDVLTPVVFGESMEKYLGQTRGAVQLVLKVVRRANQRLVLESIACDSKELNFDLKGDVFVDSVRMTEAQQQLQHFEEGLKRQITDAQQEYRRQKQAAADQSTLNVLQQKVAEAQAALNSDVSNATRERFNEEIRQGRKSAVPLSDGGQVLKNDIHKFHQSITWPAVIYLQGWPDIGSRIKEMTSKLGALKARPRSERPDSPYVAMRDRLHGLLKQDVAIDSNDSHVLLIEDRPVEEVSLGTWLALGFAAICETANDNTLVVWDEPETGLHPTWARKVADLMQRETRRFLVATHRTEFVPLGGPVGRVYKTLARPQVPGQKAICTVHEASGLLHGFSIAAALGLEPSRVLFTANAVLWVEGPSDIIYWRFWLVEAARARGVQLVEGFDYCFMFSGGSLLADETFGSEKLAPEAVDLLRLVGASLVIVDTDFNPDDEKSSRVSREQLSELLRNTNLWRPFGFVFPDCHGFLKPRVRTLLATLTGLKDANNLSTVVSTWGREAENGLTDEAFRRVLRRIYGVKGTDREADILDVVSVEDWRSYENEIEKSLEKHVGDATLTKLWTQRDGKQIVAQMSIVRDKTEFARAYVETSSELGLDSVRRELRGIVEEVLDWVLRVKNSYG